MEVDEAVVLTLARGERSALESIRTSIYPLVVVLGSAGARDGGEIELEYELRGTGEAVVLIHPGHFAAWFTPLLDETDLADHYRVLRYHRVGCAGSSHVDGPVSIAEQAAHCRGLMRTLGFDRAHIAGHSSSGNLALQIALDTPDAAHSLALLEPALMPVPDAQTSRAFIGTAAQLYRAGDKAGAIHVFLQGTCGPGYREVLDRALPGSFDQSVADADTFFSQELPALQQWRFTPEDAARITQPVLAVMGAKSRELDPIWEQRHQLLRSWLPNVESFILPEATHLLQVQNPGGMAKGLMAFFARHPLGVS
jgi:pimeloyl-ACP methyl ester carboxylesterase